VPDVTAWKRRQAHERGAEERLRKVCKRCVTVRGVEEVLCARLLHARCLLPVQPEPKVAFIESLACPSARRLDFDNHPDDVTPCACHFYERKVHAALYRC
jgi:hypothetical protein